MKGVTYDLDAGLLIFITKENFVNETVEYRDECLTQ